MNMSNRAFQGATALVGLAVLLAILAIGAMILFLFCHSTTVFHVCAWVQLISGMKRAFFCPSGMNPLTLAGAALVAGCALYPYGWSQDTVQTVCGSSAGAFQFGKCGIRWAYILAAIGCLDAIVLATLAFILATRHVTLQAEPSYAPASLYKGMLRSSIILATLTCVVQGKWIVPMWVTRPAWQEAENRWICIRCCWCLQAKMTLIPNSRSGQFPGPYTPVTIRIHILCTGIFSCEFFKPPQRKALYSVDF